MTLREDMLDVLADLRQLNDVELGLRRYTLYVRRRTPSDGRGGIGATYTTVDTLIAEKPRVRFASDKDVAESAGRIMPADVLLDCITPRNDANTVGLAYATINATPASERQGVFWVLDGPGMPTYVGGSTPSGGGLFTMVELDVSGSFSWKATLRPATGRI